MVLGFRLAVGKVFMQAFAINSIVSYDTRVWERLTALKGRGVSMRVAASFLVFLQVVFSFLSLSGAVTCGPTNDESTLVND